MFCQWRAKIKFGNGTLLKKRWIIVVTVVTVASWGERTPNINVFQQLQIQKITLLGVNPTMIFSKSHVRCYVSVIVSGEGRHTTHLLRCVRLLSTSEADWRQFSNIFLNIFFDIFPDISSNIISDIPSRIFPNILSGSSQTSLLVHK